MPDNVLGWWLTILAPSTVKNLGTKFLPPLSSLESWDGLEFLIHLSLRGAQELTEVLYLSESLLPLGHGVEQLEGDPGDETGHPQQDNLVALSPCPIYSLGVKIDSGRGPRGKKVVTGADLDSRQLALLN